MVVARTSAVPTSSPEVSIPIAIPARSWGTQELISLERLGRTKPKPAPKRKVKASSSEPVVAVLLKKLPRNTMMAPIPAALRTPIRSAMRPPGMAVISRRGNFPGL